LQKVQFISVLALLVGLIGYGIYTRVGMEFSFRYEHDDRYQVYNPDKPPKLVHFAGEAVPLENKAVADLFSQELRLNTRHNVSWIPVIERGRHWLPKIAPILRQYKIPEDFKYLAVVESMLLNVQSSKGAGGFWQMIPLTAREYGLEVNEEVDERYHPIKATLAACKYFQEAYRWFGDWTSVAASYNAGMYALDRAYRKQGEASFYGLKLNKQTTIYVFRVLAVRQLLEHPKAYGYKVSRHDPLYEPLKTVKVEASIPDLTAFAAEHGISFATLRRHNPWLLQNTLTLKEEGKTYALLIPRKKEILATSQPAELPALEMLPEMLEDSVEVGMRR
jgi:hypothetical protein